jgi:hypothetical protein
MAATHLNAGIPAPHFIKQAVKGALTPAYGRDYDNFEDALAAWNEGKDFQVNCMDGSTYCYNIRDTEDAPAGLTLTIRWNLTQCAIIAKQEDGSFSNLGMMWTVLPGRAF